MPLPDFGFLDVQHSGPVVTVAILNTSKPEAAGWVRDRHWELGALFSALRDDMESRVVVLTGAEPGRFLVGPTTEQLSQQAEARDRNDPDTLWEIFAGIIRCHEAMAALEKPIVAKVNGDAMGFGASIVFACDLIVASEDARISDLHLGMGTVKPYGPPYGLVPGDGGAALVPLFMTPTKAKEYLMLSPDLSAAQLAAMGVVNWAVPAAQLDKAADDVVAKLLARPTRALAWTKRLVNRHVIAQLNMTLDASVAYEMVNLYQLERTGWKDPETTT